MELASPLFHSSEGLSSKSERSFYKIIFFPPLYARAQDCMSQLPSHGFIR